MEMFLITVYAVICASWIITILLWKHDSRKKQRAHEDELLEMEVSCQEREQYEQNKYNQLNKAFTELQIKYELERNRNRNLRPGFNVQAVAKAVDKVKGVRVS